MRIALQTGQTVKIFKGDKKCPKTVLMSFSGSINNFSDIYISSNLQDLQNGKTFVNNVGSNSLDAGVGIFNQGVGAAGSPRIFPGVTSDIYARYDQQSSVHASVDLEVEFF